MESIVIPLALVGAIVTFASWLSVMLRHERNQGLALVAAAQARVEAHRQHARAARHAPTAEQPDTSIDDAATVSTLSTTSAVRAGSFCRVPGNVGRTKKGVVLVCSPSAHGRPRWRRPAPLRAAS